MVSREEREGGEGIHLPSPSLPSHPSRDIFGPNRTCQHRPKLPSCRRPNDLMALIIREATPADAARWSELLKQALGSDPAVEQVYDLNRASSQLIGPQVEVTWIAELDGQLCGSICILGAETPTPNPVANLARFFVLPNSYENGSARALLSSLVEVIARRKQIAVIRVPASDKAQQVLLEEAGFVCVGFQPLKHQCLVREGILFYLKTAGPDTVARYTLSQSLAHVAELGSVVLENLSLPNPTIVRDGLTGYPLQADFKLDEVSPAAYAAHQAAPPEARPPVA